MDLRNRFFVSMSAVTTAVAAVLTLANVAAAEPLRPTGAFSEARLSQTAEAAAPRAGQKAVAVIPSEKSLAAEVKSWVKTKN